MKFNQPAKEGDTLMKVKLYVALARLVQARANAFSSGQSDGWFFRHGERARELVNEYMPSGSGIDSGTTLDFDRSTSEKLVFSTSYHHMTEGVYDGWTEHTVTCRASLASGITLGIGGRDRNGVKDDLHERFHEALNTEVEA
jgi:hypothetical protein